MTDYLHARIANAIKDVDDMRVCKLSNTDIKFITDAVLTELGLQQSCTATQNFHTNIASSSPTEPIPNYTNTCTPGCPDCAELTWRDTTNTTTQYRVTVKIYNSVFDDIPDHAIIWHGTRPEIETKAANYADANSTNPLFHMEIDTIETTQ